jgi:GR25 family glycosyltransferase involved in LPS biosynthesis
MFTTFVINLDKDVDRLHFMDEQLSLLNIVYQREPAVYGKNYKPLESEYDEVQALKKGGYALLPGEMGCALSHARVIEKIVSQNIKYALVLEDDVTLPSNLCQIISSLIKKNEKNRKWEYLLFDYFSVGLPFIKRWFLVSGRHLKLQYQKNVFSFICAFIFIVFKGFFIIPLALFEGIRNLYKISFPGPVNFFRPLYFAGAYLVTYEGALKLRSLSQPVIYTADHLPNRARLLKGLKFMAYSPQVVKQEKRVFGSSILDKTGEELI